MHTVLRNGIEYRYFVLSVGNKLCIKGEEAYIVRIKRGWSRSYIALRFIESRRVLFLRVNENDIIDFSLFRFEDIGNLDYLDSVSQITVFTEA